MEQYIDKAKASGNVQEFYYNLEDELLAQIDKNVVYSEFLPKAYDYCKKHGISRENFKA